MDKRLFGYNKKQVDQYIEDRLLQNEKELDILKKKKQDCLNIKDSLEEELKRLKEEKDHYEVKKMLMESVKNHVEKTDEFFQKRVEEEINEILEKAKEEMKELELELENKALEGKEISRQFNSIEELAENLIKSLDPEKIMDGEKHLEDEITRFKMKKEQKKELESFNKDKNEVKSEKIVEEALEKEAKEEIEEEKEELQNKRQEEKANSFWNLNEKKVTADGLSLTKIPPLNFKRHKEKESVTAGERNEIEKELQNESEGVRIKEKQREIEFEGSFWGDMQESFTNQDRIDAEKILEERRKAPRIEVAATKLEEEVIIQEVKHVNKKVYESQEEPPRENKSEEVSEEIKRIRTKYILGKVAGEDVFDGQGSVIITKGVPITQEVISRAEEAGKLSELIIHMILPGME